jgi:IclR family acetate operon transcriptional repressor
VESAEIDQRQQNGHDVPPPSPPTERNGIQSVDRALGLLDAIVEMGGQATLTELSRSAGLNISTCHHLLATLSRRGFVAKVAGRRSYELGAHILHLGQACLRQVDLPHRARPFVEQINRATGETVHLCVLQGENVVTVLKRDGRHAVRVDTGLGETHAVHATATGKAMLAWLPEDEIRRIVAARGMTRFTPSTIVDFSALIEELRLVRRNGYAADREEFQPGVICIGAAVRNNAGAVVGAISVSAPTMRTTDEHLELMRREVMAAARALSAELGEPGSQQPAGRPNVVSD